MLAISHIVILITGCPFPSQAFVLGDARFSSVGID